MKVPFLDLHTQYLSIRTEIEAALQGVLDTSAFAGGPFVTRFEEEFAAFCGCAHALGVGSGTDALWLSLQAVGVGPGDEVITVPNSFIATAEAISFCGARPVFVDVDETSCTMNPALIEAAVTPKTRAIIPVHLFGQPADMDPIIDIARRRGLAVIEDACQAHGARYKDRPAGSIGDAGCFSFYPGKNLGAYGEAGAVVTNNPDIAYKVRILRDHGQRQKYDHELIGCNARMDGFQGAVLSVKLRRLDEWNEQRRARAALYTALLGKTAEVILPREMPYARHVYHIYAIRVRARDETLRSLTDRGIACGIHYPVPIHLQDAYRHLGLGRGSLPVAEECADQFISLPIFPEMTEDQVRITAGELRNVVEGRLHA